MLRGERVPPWLWATGADGAETSSTKQRLTPGASNRWGVPIPVPRIARRGSVHDGAAESTPRPHRPARIDVIAKAAGSSLLVIAAAILSIAALPLWLIAGSIDAGVGQIVAVAAATCTTTSPIGLVAIAWWDAQGRNDQ